MGAEVWPRLTEKQVKLPWLKIDFDRFTFEDEDEEEENEEELQARYMAEKIAQELKEEEESQSLFCLHFDNSCP